MQAYEPGELPYALAVSFEVGVDAGIDVYEEVRERLAAPVPAAIEVGGYSHNDRS